MSRASRSALTRRSLHRVIAGDQTFAEIESGAIDGGNDVGEPNRLRSNGDGQQSERERAAISRTASTGCGLAVFNAAGVTHR